MGTAITLGSKTSTGGEVVSASSGSFINGIGIACVGDKATCKCGSKSCKGIGEITATSPRPTELNGIQFAKANDLVNTGCGSCFLLSGNNTIQLANASSSVFMGNGVYMGGVVNIGLDTPTQRSVNQQTTQQQTIIKSQANTQSQSGVSSQVNTQPQTSTRPQANTLSQSGTQIKESKEYIAVIGGQFDNSANKMMFIAQAVRYMRKYNTNKNELYTFLLVSKGYTKEQLSLAKKSCDIYNFRYKEVNSLKEITQHINNRNHTKIERLMLFAHGLPFSIELGYKLGKDQKHDESLTYNLNTLQDIDKNVFSTTAIIESYACRTGMGNPSDLSVNDVIDNISGGTVLMGALGLPTLYSLQKLKTAYGIHNIEDGIQLNPMTNKSLAQYMANYYEKPVKAFVTRSDYSNTFGSSLDRLKFKTCDINLISDDTWCNTFNEKIKERSSLLDDYEVIYNIDGALNDVTTNRLSTPLFTGEKIKVFKPL